MSSTTAKGLGWAHQQQRARLQPPAGDPCPYCRLPMWPEQRLQADHPVARAIGGTTSSLRWAHGRCNEAAGAQLGNRLRTRRSGRRWLDRWA